MIIYLSMILWVLLMRVLCAGTLQYGTLYNGQQYYKVGKWTAIITMGYIVFWVGMRIRFVDTPAYINAFNEASSNLSQIPALLASKSKGQAWKAMEIIFKALVSDNSQMWLMFHAIVMGGAVAACYKRYSEAFFFSLLIFLFSGYFTWMMNGIRQFFCVAVIMLATPWVLKGKTVHYMLLVAALSLVHFSVWLMVPVYFVVRQRPWGKMTLLAIAGTAIACLLTVQVGGLVEEALESTSYAGSTIYFENDDGAHPLRAVVAAVPAVLGWVLRKRVHAENNMMLNVGINMSILATLLFAFAVFTSGILMGRLPIFCAIYGPITLALLINRFSPASTRNILYACCCLCYAAYFLILYYGKIYYASDITGRLPEYI